MDAADRSVLAAEEPGPQQEEGERPGWYWVCATYKAINPGAPRKRHLWERTVFLIRGFSGEGLSLMEDAERAALEQKAEKVAREKEHEYEVAGGRTCRWVFQKIERIDSVSDDEFADGTEVYWELFERVDKTIS